MPMIYAAAAKTARMQAVLTLMSGGSIQIGTANMAIVLSTLDLDEDPGSVAGAVITLDVPINDPAADGTGIAAVARVRTSADANLITGLTVGMAGSGADVIIQNTNIVAGQPVSLTGATFTHAPDPT